MSTNLLILSLIRKYCPTNWVTRGCFCRIICLHQCHNGHATSRKSINCVIVPTKKTRPYFECRSRNGVQNDPAKDYEWRTPLKHTFMSRNASNDYLFFGISFTLTKYLTQNWPHQKLWNNVKLLLQKRRCFHELESWWSKSHPVNSKKRVN